MRPFVVPVPRGPVEPVAVPTFSVIIAAYQAADTVAEAVESALSQTVPPCEVVVCDDGSTDDIEGALAPYRERIVLVRRDNGGEGAAKDTAARSASGDFVVVLDADDIFLPERLEALGELAAIRPDLDLLTTDAYLEVDGRIVGRYQHDQARFVTGDQRLGILRANFVFGLAAIRREVLLKVGGFDTAMSAFADYDCWIRLILAGAQAGLVDEPLAHYRLHGHSMSADRERLLRWMVFTLEKAASRSDLSPEERHLVNERLSKHRREAALASAEGNLRRGRDAQARRKLLEITLGRGFPPRTRLKAAAAGVAPRAAARRLEAQETKGSVSRLTRRVSTELGPGAIDGATSTES